MPDKDITIQQIKDRLGNVKYNDWIALAKSQGLLIIYNGGGSHYTNVRDPKNPNRQDPRGLITTLTPNGCFKQANEKILKKFIKYGVSLEIIWDKLRLKR